MTATVEVLPRPANRLEGYVDAIEDGRVYGWAWDRLNPSDRLTIEVFRDGMTVASLTADRVRSDLAAGGIGDGGHSFEVQAGDGPITVVAVSPQNGERIELKLRGPEDEAAASAALLRKMAGTIEAFAGNRTTGLEDILARVEATQANLQRQMDSMDVFLLRFDSLLRELAEAKQAAAQPPATGWLARLLGK